MRIARLLLVGLILLAACSSGTATTNSTVANVLTQVRKLPVVALPGYDVSVFTQNDSRLTVANPDSVVVDGQHVFIDYQNVTAKDCTDADKASSTVVEYDMQGNILGHWSVAGHSDGMRIDPATHLIWTTSCEDGSPRFATIDPATGTVTPYTFPTPPHGGGYDDLYFLNGSTFVAASNPSLDSGGNNPNAAIDKIALGANGKLVLTPVLYGNASAADLLNNNAAAGLTLTDPDSLSVDNKGQLVLVSQADSTLVFINSPGTAQQKVSKMAVGTQLDDTVWPTGPGRLLVVDAGGVTYWISGSFASGDVYTQSPNDSGVDNFVATIAPATGFVTPIAIGFTKTTGMVFVPSS
ncbi:MAG TPA: hypothetical protein VLR46_05395 [Candidatus Dormibacteraeota bacterium]|nr:hypothetical protein [Candidatus Dormibacteraeota bacterium]